jgi:hypothetical protein
MAIYTTNGAAGVTTEQANENTTYLRDRLVEMGYEPRLTDLDKVIGGDSFDLAVVLGNRHAAFEWEGFVCGIDGVDCIDGQNGEDYDNVDLETAIAFLTADD